MCNVIASLKNCLMINEYNSFVWLALMKSLMTCFDFCFKQVLE
jgi:hypothetical protein